MKMKFLNLIILCVTFLNFGYANSNSAPIFEPDTNYYGADLTQFPPNVRKWVVNKAFTKEKMERPAMINPQLKVWWSEDNNAVLAEASYTIAEGYVGAGTLETWGQEARFFGSPAIFNVYGEHAKYHTLRFEWELKQEVEQLLENDPAYSEIITFAKQLSDEIEYDWKNFPGYKGPVKRTPGKKYFLCDGYANEVMNRILDLNSVQAVQRWVSSNHAWNVVKLTDGRTLYLDLTWFDNEDIDQKTGKIYQTDDYRWANITFNEELFRYSSVGYGDRVFHHALGKFDKEVIK
ncbi:MAG: hypothetical protein FWD09_05475 [Lentimicrobiaceae bacterium]|nr:hypothetical protein [Lentimicrobiaceae bacterium]